MASRTYYLVLFEAGRTGVTSALKSILSEQSAELILKDVGRPTITRKEDGKKYLIMDKKLFEYKNLDGSITLFIVCNAEKIK